MRILLDTAALQSGGDGALFWSRLLQAIPAVAGGHELTVLVRDDTVVLPQSSGCRLLHAPPVDRQRPAKEAERLACLCRRLGSDLFIGSWYTCPAADMVSLLFVYDMEPELFPTGYHGDDPILVAKRMAIRCAHSFAVFTHAVSADLSAFYDLEDSRINCIPYLSGLGTTDVQHYARRLLMAGEYACGTRLSEQATAQLAMTIEALKQQSYGWDLYENASHAIGKLLDHQYFVQAVQLAREAQSELTGYAEYFDSTLERCKLPDRLAEQLLLDRVAAYASDGETSLAGKLLDAFVELYPQHIAAREWCDRLRNC